MINKKRRLSVGLQEGPEYGIAGGGYKLDRPTRCLTRPWHALALDSLEKRRAELEPSRHLGVDWVLGFF